MGAGPQVVGAQLVEAAEADAQFGGDRCGREAAGTGLGEEVADQWRGDAVEELEFCMARKMAGSWILRLETAPAECRATIGVMARPAGGQASDGARVASPQSPMAKFDEQELTALAADMTKEQRTMFYSQFQVQQKNRSTALALGIIPVVGHFGGGRFYLGHVGLGILHIALMICYGLPGVVYWIIDAFLIGSACDEWNRSKAKAIAAQVKSVG